MYSAVKAMPNADASGQNGPQQHRASRVGGQERRPGLIGDDHVEDPGAVQSIGHPTLRSASAERLSLAFWRFSYAEPCL